MNLLDVSGLTVFYGPVRGVESVTLSVGEGEIVALLGANGAGKSTVLKAISGLVKPRSGSVSLFGKPIDKLSPHRRVAGGLVQVPEGRHILGSMTVRENLELGTYSVRQRRGDRGDRLAEMLELFPMLETHLPKLAGMLSGGEQQLLAIARGLLSRPKLLLIDEPSLGLAPQMVDLVYDQLQEIVGRGTPVLLVEQNVSLALEVAGRAYVLQQGSVVIEGPAEALASDRRVAEAYLGADVAS
ncbi:MAG: ABC transporter ATP-binding protein [Acidimicrobiales bacterium]